MDNDCAKCGVQQDRPIHDRQYAHFDHDYDPPGSAITVAEIVRRWNVGDSPDQLGLKVLEDEERELVRLLEASAPQWCPNSAKGPHRWTDGVCDFCSMEKPMAKLPAAENVCCMRAINRTLDALAKGVTGLQATHNAEGVTVRRMEVHVLIFNHRHKDGS